MKKRFICILSVLMLISLALTTLAFASCGDGGSEIKTTAGDEEKTDSETTDAKDEEKKIDYGSFSISSFRLVYSDSASVDVSKCVNNLKMSIRTLTGAVLQTATDASAGRKNFEIVVGSDKYEKIADVNATLSGDLYKIVTEADESSMRIYICGLTDDALIAGIGKFTSIIEDGNFCTSDGKLSGAVNAEGDGHVDKIEENLTVKINESGIIGRTTEGYYKYYGWPSICKDENGKLYAVVSNRLLHVDPLGRNCMFTSEDGGTTWSDATVINDTKMDDRDSGIVYLGDGKMLVTYFNNNNTIFDDYKEWRGILPPEKIQEIENGWSSLPEDITNGGSYVILSDDYGKTWESPIEVPVSSPHGPILLKNGKILYVGRGIGMGCTGNNIYACISADGGRTWSVKGTIPCGEKYSASKNNTVACEPYAYQLANGRIIAAIRLQGTDAPEKFSIGISFSDDMGKSWSKMTELGFEGSPPHITQLENGVVVLTYAKRQAVTGEYVRISYDNGATWGEEILISRPVSKTDSDLGYPATLVLDDGSLITVYYQKYKNDTSTSLLYTKWELVPEEK